MLALIMLLAGTLYAPAQANDSAATNDAAVVKAQANAAGPGLWKVTDLKVITGPGPRDGNTYVDGKVVAGKFTKSSYCADAYPGKIMSTYGSAATSASWVTVGGELKSYLTNFGVTAAKQKAKPPARIAEGLNALRTKIEAGGPLQPRTPHFGKLSGWPGEM